MNERDYLIAEAMVLSTGSFVSVTIAMIFWLFHLPFGLGSTLALSFVGFCTFFLGLYLHMKRRIMILENEAVLNRIKGDKT